MNDRLEVSEWSVFWRLLALVAVAYVWGRTDSWWFLLGSAIVGVLVESWIVKQIEGSNE